MKSQVREGMAIKALEPVALDLDRIHEAAEMELAKVASGNRFSDAYKTQLFAPVIADREAKVERAIGEYRKVRYRPLDDEEGQIRAALLASDPTAALREQRASRFANLMSNALTADQIHASWAEALLTGDGDVIHSAGAAGLKRFADLVTSKKPIPSQHAEMQARFSAFEIEVANRTRLHPSPARRLAEIERERARIDVAIKETATFVARLYGAGDASRIGPGFSQGPGFPRRPSRASEGNSRFRVGPAFDALTGGTPSGARRLSDTGDRT